MRVAIRLANLVAGVSTILGCGLASAPFVCTDEARPAIAVDIHDSVTGAFEGAGARAIVADGSYADTAFAEMTGFPYYLAFERPGTYTVTVEKPGYQPWTSRGITVTRDRCHVRTVSLVARIQQ